MKIIDGKIWWERSDIALAETNTAGIDGVNNDVVEVLTTDEYNSTHCYLHTGLRKGQKWWFNNCDLLPIEKQL